TGARAWFGSAASRTITLTSGVTVGAINLANPNGDTITGSTITFATNALAGAINAGATSGSNTIASALSLTNGLNVNVLTTGASLTISGAVSGTGNLTKGGVGTLTVSGTNTYSGRTIVAAGKLIMGSTSSVPSGSSVSVDDGILDLNNLSITLASLDGGG